MGGTDYAAACQDVFDRITATRPSPIYVPGQDGGGGFGEEPAPRLIHRAHEALDDAADVAARRTVSDGGWVWSRARSTGDVSALEAATLAAWAVLRNPAPAVAPFMLFG
jgi:hypothetical protein